MARIGSEEAAFITGGSWAGEAPQSPFVSFAIDTRTLRVGDVFLALKGSRCDGHAFLEEASRLGALAALVEHSDTRLDLPQLVVQDVLKALQALAGTWRKKFKSRVIAVTGSYGKTTVKELLGTLLGSIWFRSPGNFNNHLGVPLSLLDLDPAHHAGAILEAGINQPGEMTRLAEMIRPDMAIITAVGPAHLEMLGSLEGVAREKARLAETVRDGGEVFLPASLLEYKAFRELPESLHIHAIASRGTPLPSGANAMSNLQIYHYDWTDTRSSRGMGELLTGSPMSSDKFHFAAGSPGMVSNLALAVTIGLQMGIPPSTLQSRLEAWRPFRHRGEVIRAGATDFFVDCYNANPSAMIDSSSRFAALFVGRPLLYVMGSMNELGEASEYWHRETARRMELPGDAEFYLIGHGAAWMRAGLIDREIPSGRIHLMDDLDLVRHRLASFTGAVFLKGSRSYQLESLLPGGPLPC